MEGVRHAGSGPVRLPAFAAHVFVDDLVQPVLVEDDAHHLGRVLRLRDGEAVTAADGVGKWRPCRFTGGALEATGDVVVTEKPAPTVTIAFALTKGDKPELVIQKLTELGVDRIVPLLAGHTVVRWDEAKAARNAERFRAVARSAAMQSRRAWLPQVDGVTTLGELAAAVTDLALAHPGGLPLSPASTVVAVGPEGGWTDDELTAVDRHVDLGGTTLRAETAALSAGVLLTALRDGRVEARLSPGSS
ncbi:MAG: rRNA (uracil1498-N3)-methyltransferase [Actinomycetota bacterium]|jgi:16S rRNA (uracil1498-N3)-methyltransferase